MINTIFHRRFFCQSSGQPIPLVYAEIWTPEVNPPLHTKEDRVQIVTNDEFPFLGMKMSRSPEGDLQFGVFTKKRQELKYVWKESTHTPGSLRVVPSGVLNQLCQTHLKKTLDSLCGGRQDLSRQRERSLQGGPRTTKMDWQTFYPMRR